MHALVAVPVLSALFDKNIRILFSPTALFSLTPWPNSLVAELAHPRHYLYRYPGRGLARPSSVFAPPGRFAVRGSLAVETEEVRT